MNLLKSLLHTGSFGLAMVLAPAALGQVNHVRNGTFEAIENGAPAMWSMEGDEGVEQRVTYDAGVTSGHSVKLECTQFSRKTRDSYATLSQYGFSELKQGTWYRFSCWARQEGMASAMATVELYGNMDLPAPYTSSTLFKQLPLGPEWQRFEHYFTPSADCTDRARLFFYFDFTGTMWLDDVEIVEVPAPDIAFTSLVMETGGKNLIPNGSFECGEYRWSSIGKPVSFTWGLTGLFGEVQSGGAAHGDQCLRVDLAPGTIPLSTFNCRLECVEQDAPLAANLGWTKTEVGTPYTLSAYLRADRDGVPAKLLIRYGAPNEGYADESSTVMLSTDWQRYTLTSTAAKPFAFAAVGPVLTDSGFTEASVWIDGVQLERGETATGFSTQEPVEIGLTTERYGNVFDETEAMLLNVSASNGTKVPATVRVTLNIRDYFGDVVGTRSKEIQVSGESTVQTDWDLELGDLGYYQVEAAWEVNGTLHEESLRMARIEEYRHQDSVFGMNHAPTTDELCEQMRRGGSVYAREWSMEWEDIEPAPGDFQFADVDTHVDRVVATGMLNVQQLPPFPSVSWNSSAPAGEQYAVPGVWWEYYAPKDVNLFARYADTVVRHFKDRIRVWEYLNEPFYTIYSLPNVQQMDATVPALKEANYTIADYVALLKVFHETVKAADPGAVTIGGMGGRPDLLTKEFFEAGGLNYLDVFNLHIYPGLRNPEGYIPQMEELLADMSESEAGVKPIWITEYAYYGADNLPYEPFIVGPGPWGSNRMLRDERQCADYTIRFNLVMLAHGVEKQFYHVNGTDCAPPNADAILNESMLTAFAGTPRKLYVAQSVLANLLGPDPKPTAAKPSLALPDGGDAVGVYGFSFQCGDRALVAAWAPSEENGQQSWDLTIPAEAHVINVAGVELSGDRFTLGDSPLYVVSTSVAAGDLARQCTFHPAP